MTHHSVKLLLLIWLGTCSISSSAGDSIQVSAATLNQLMSRVEQLEKAQQQLASPPDKALPTNEDTATNRDKKAFSKGHLTLGGYGEATVKRCFYSNNYLRYYNPEKYANDQYGEFDLPHVVFYIGYDFGRGWSMSSEIEFEHGGNEAAVEIEEEEGGEYETEVERGGEVALEQFWLQKSFSPAANIRAGMLIVPVGGTNAHHEPDKFFGVYRPEGDNTILPCTWHDIGIQFHGRYKWLGYTAQFLPGLESDLFGNQSWIHYGSASPYEFKLGNTYAFAARTDFYPLYNHSDKGTLRLGLSGYCGTSFKNNLTLTQSDTYKDVKGLVTLISLDWLYRGHNLLFRGSALYGHLGDAAAIVTYNMSMPKSSVSKRQNIGSDAYTLGAEIGYDFFALSPKLKAQHQQFYLFARYDAYDPMAQVAIGSKKYWAGRQKLSVGLNYFPIPQVIIKGEFGYRMINQDPTATTAYNNEPYIAFSINYFGMFNL